MTKKELLTEKELLKHEIDDILATCDKENRDPTYEETKRWEYLEQRVKVLDALLTRHAGVSINKGGKSMETVLPANIGEYFYLMDYRSHYKNFLKGLFNKRRAICELFLLRAWACQCILRMTSESEEREDKIVYEIVNLTNTLAKGIVEMTAKIDIEKQLGSKFEILLGERWGEYDHVVINNKHVAEPLYFLTELCIRVMDKCHISGQNKFSWLLIDLTQLMEDIASKANPLEK